MDNKIPIKIGVLASGSGSNFQALLDATKTSLLQKAEISILISNKKDAYALERARTSSIESLFISPKDYSNRMVYFEKISDELKKRKVDLICLAGFLLKLEPNILKDFRNRILNIHPSLLPLYGGPGMYGHFVHEAVIRNNEKESGCTVHKVDQEYDHGEIVLQRKVSILPGETAESLAKKVLVQEHLLYPEAVVKILNLINKTK